MEMKSKKIIYVAKFLYFVIVIISTVLGMYTIERGKDIFGGIVLLSIGIAFAILFRFSEKCENKQT